MSTSRSRSNHDSKTTCCPVVAAQYHPGKWHPPHDHRNGRTGTASSNLAVAQSSNGRRLLLPRLSSTRHDTSTYGAVLSTPVDTDIRPPGVITSPTRFTVRKAETTEFAVKRLGWMTKDSSPGADRKDRRKTGQGALTHVNVDDLARNARSER